MIQIELIKENEIQDVCDTVARACKNSVLAEFYPPDPKWFSVTYDEVKQKAESDHLYVVKDNGRIIGCGCVGAYDGSLAESLISTVFVDPIYQGKGVGRKIVEFLENDGYAKRASRIEIHAAISAIPFYRKLGYEHKNGQLNYGDGYFCLEKYLSVNSKNI